jgi:hypothetical protein
MKEFQGNQASTVDSPMGHQLAQRRRRTCMNIISNSTRIEIHPSGTIVSNMKAVRRERWETGYVRESLIQSSASWHQQGGAYGQASID